MIGSSVRFVKSPRSGLALVALAFATPAIFPSSAAAISTTVVISQIYASGGQSGATWRNDYVVLFNKGTASVSLAGWALQFRPSAGGIWPRVPLCGTIAHGHYYLVQLGQGGPVGATLPTPDCSSPFNIDPIQGAMALTSNQSPISTSCVTGPIVVDLVGYGSGASCAETSPAPPSDLIRAILRTAACTDTDDNTADFSLTPASPQNSSAANGCNNQAPSLNPISDQTLREGTVRSFFAIATDGDGDPVTYGGSGPAWFTINATSGECTFAPDLSAAETNGGGYSASVTATDGIATSSDGFAIKVTDLTTAANIPDSGVWPGGVDMATNELFFALPPDLCLGGPLPLCFGRYYASLHARVGAPPSPAGTNWTTTYWWRFNPNGSTATIVDDRGETLLFTRTPTGDWSQANHFEEKLQLSVRAFDNMHRLHRGRRTYEFDPTSGLLQKILDEHGNVLNCAYTSGLLSSVSDGLGRMLTFTYDSNDRLISASDGTRSVSYGHVGNLLSSFTDAEGHTTNYAYATGTYPGLLESETPPMGAAPATYAYDADGLVDSWTDAFLNTWTFGVGPGGGCAVTTPAADVWESFHDGGLKLESLHDPLGGTTSWTYDSSDRIASVMRPLGDITTFEYDPASGFPSALGRGDGTHLLLSYAGMPIDGFDVFHLTAASYPDGASEGFSYDTAGNLVTHTDRAGKQWTGTYNPNGQPLTRTNPAGGVTTFTYDSMLRLASHTDDANNTTSFAYDPLDRLAHLGHPDATGRDYAYDALDHLTSMTDERGKIWSRGYDLNGRVVSSTDPLQHTVGFTYDAMDRVTGVMDALGKTSAYAYDAVGRLASATDRTNRTTIYAYDALDRLVQRSDPGGYPTQFGYDANGRLLTVTDPLGHAMTYEHDALDRVTRTTDPLQNAVDYAYDSMGRLTSLTPPPIAAPTIYHYDSRGLLTGWVRQNSQVEIGRSSIGSISSIGDPNIKVWPFGHDAQGRMTSRADPLGRTTSFTYDSRSRVSHVTTPVGTGDFTYDPAGDGLECQWLDANGSVTLGYVYDDARRLTAATGATFAYDDANRVIGTNGLTFTRDDEGRITSKTYAAGKVVTYAYNTRGLLSEVADWLGGTTSFAYDAAGRLTGITRPNGTTATYAYDAANRLTQLVERQPGPVSLPPLASIALTRDTLGRVTSAARDVPRKPTSTAPYDSTGYAYDDASQVVGFSHDGLGRLLSDGTRTFAYDAGGRMASYNAGEGIPPATYTYDAFGRALTRVQGATTRQDVWDVGARNWGGEEFAPSQPHLLAVVQSGPNITIFVGSPNGMLYKVDGSGNRTFYHYDEAGNTMFLTNDNGVVVASYAYSPTGKPDGLGYITENSFTYAGALGVMQEGPDLFSRSGSTIVDTKTARCISCPSAPLATLGARPGVMKQPGPGGSPLDFVGRNPGPVETSGLAEVFGNDALLSLGSRATGVIGLVAGGLSGILAMSGLISTGVVPVHPHRAGTILHEIGHAIGLAHGGGGLSVYDERVANEGSLGTATERRSLRGHLRLLSYEPHPGEAARSISVIPTKDRYLAGTMAHELGHTLELCHGGADDALNDAWEDQGWIDVDCDNCGTGPDTSVPPRISAQVDPGIHGGVLDPWRVFRLLGIGGPNPPVPDPPDSDWPTIIYEFSCQPWYEN